ncbi:MAG: patatin-like phospholipase family protein [Deltaproteobacteria bacterium]|nr:patatin-like phospholipase family protein [Deltaproteobacteria bacterium]
MIKNTGKSIHLIRLDLSDAAVRILQEKCDEVLLHATRTKNEYYVSPLSLQKLEILKISHRVLKNLRADDLPIDIVYPFQSFLFDAPNEDAILEVKTFAMAQRRGSRRVKVLYWARSSQQNVAESFTLDRPGGKRAYRWSIAKDGAKIVSLADKFPKIIRKIRDPETRVILSFGSGGVRLFAHPSLMKFIELLNLTSCVQEIWGSSGGAVAGLMYSMGVDPTVIEKEGYNLYNNRYSLRFSPSKLEVLMNLLADTFIPAGDNLLRGFLDCQKALRFMISKHLTRSRKRKIPFYCIAYNLREKRNEVLTPEKVPKDIYLTPTHHADALDAVIASSSIPILYVPKKILRGKTEYIYVDGGTTEEVPLITPYRKWTRDRLNFPKTRKKLLILAVNLFPSISSIPFFSHYRRAQRASHKGQGRDAMGIDSAGKGDEHPQSQEHPGNHPHGPTRLLEAVAGDRGKSLGLQVGREQFRPLIPGIADVNDPGQDADDNHRQDGDSHQGPFGHGIGGIGVTGGASRGPTRLGKRDAEHAGR